MPDDGLVQYHRAEALKLTRRELVSFLSFTTGFSPEGTRLALDMIEQRRKALRKLRAVEARAKKAVSS